MHLFCYEPCMDLETFHLCYCCSVGGRDIFNSTAEVPLSKLLNSPYAQHPYPWQVTQPHPPP